jgi:hypothetical protein
MPPDKHLGHSIERRVKDLEEKFAQHMDQCDRTEDIVHAIDRVTKAVRESKGDWTAAEEKDIADKLIDLNKASTVPPVVK